MCGASNGDDARRVPRTRRSAPRLARADCADAVRWYHLAGRARTRARRGRAIPGGRVPTSDDTKWIARGVSLLRLLTLLRPFLENVQYESVAGASYSQTYQDRGRMRNAAVGVGRKLVVR